MKTDLERFIELYRSFGIECKAFEENDKKFILLGERPYNPERKQVTKSDKFGGHNYFYSDVWFTKEGKFIKQGFWE